MSLFRKVEISVAIAIVASIFFSVLSFAATSEKIRNDVLRLHVIANSDSTVDQNLKLAVRDEILLKGKELFNGSVNVNNAVEKISPHIEELEYYAEEIINQRGYSYPVEITIGKEYYKTRTYKTVTLPAGEYLSLIVRIGEAQGKNWWCVMFPPMCISVADENTVLKDVMNEEELKLVNSNPQFEPRFKIIEIIENLKNKFR